MTYSDEYIDHMGEIFTATPIFRRVCTFEQFLRWPRECAFAAGRAAAVANAVEQAVALLPKQREVQQRLDAAGRQA